MAAVIRLLADAGEFLELQPHYGGSMIVGLLRLGGHPCLVVANQPAVLAGAISAEAAAKATHFLSLAESYHLPVVFLADNPGVMSGTHAERAGTLRAAARMYAAQAALSGPKLHVTLRKAYGFGSSLMAMNPFDAQTLTLAFPGISLGGLPAGSGGAAAKLDAAAREQLVAAVADSAWSSADTMAYDEIIDPRQMRNALLRGLQLALGRRSEGTQLSAVGAVNR
jgi:acetyl-CoA carboxylase carboxyltransferase component